MLPSQLLQPGLQTAPVSLQELLTQAMTALASAQSVEHDPQWALVILRSVSHPSVDLLLLQSPQFVWQLPNEHELLLQEELTLGRVQEAPQAPQLLPSSLRCASQPSDISLLQFA